MGRGIEIPLTVNPSRLVRGMRVTEREFDDLADTVEDVARESDDLERGYEDAFRGMARDADKASRSVEGSLGDIGDEAHQEAVQVAASFDGSVESVADGFQSLASEVSRIIPGIGGAIAGLAGGAAIGLVLSSLQKWEETNKRIWDQANELYDIYVEHGNILDENVQKEIEKQAIEEIGNGNYLQGLIKVQNLAAVLGATTEETTAALIAGDEALIEQAERTADSEYEAKALRKTWEDTLGDMDETALAVNRLEVAEKNAEAQAARIRAQYEGIRREAERARRAVGPGGVVRYPPKG